MQHFSPHFQTPILDQQLAAGFLEKSSIPIPVPLVHFKVNQQQKITSDLRPFWLDSTFHLFGDCMIALFICMCVSLCIWLVVSTPPKNMKVSWDDYSQYMEK
jgi:hypothetical protein